VRIVRYLVALAVSSGLFALATPAPAGWVPIRPKAPVSRGCAFVPKGYLCSTATQIRFAYPRTWNALPYNDGGLRSRSLIYLSTERLHDPCTSTTDGDTTVVRCGSPISALSPDGVFAVWRLTYLAKPLDALPGDPLLVGNRPARVLIATSGGYYEGCRLLGGDESTTVWIAGRPTADAYTFTVCLRGPHISTAEHQVRVLLASTRFRHP
jgi:hypothetical protein